MGNKTEFVRVADILIDTLDFDQDINVSVFETNIRGTIDHYFSLLYTEIKVSNITRTCLDYLYITNSIESLYLL